MYALTVLPSSQCSDNFPEEPTLAKFLPIPFEILLVFAFVSAVWEFGSTDAGRI
jgi:hypothetical protein